MLNIYKVNYAPTFDSVVPTLSIFGKEIENTMSTGCIFTIIHFSFIQYRTVLEAIKYPLLAEQINKFVNLCSGILLKD